MRRLGLALALLLSASFAFAQNAPSANPPIGIAGAYNASPPTCTSGQGCWIQTDINGKLLSTATSTITGFDPLTTGTPISVTTGGVTGTLPAGTVVVASNVGGTNNAFCKLGASATTADQLIAPSSWFAFTVGAATQLTCITSTSTTTVNMVGGSGIATGAGGGGGGGAAITNYALETGGNLATIATAVAAPIPTQATSVTIGGVTTDPCGQTTKTNLPISFQTTSSTQLIALSGSTKIYVCSLSLIASAATVFSITGGTGSACGTPAALIGTTVAAHGLSLAANGGLTLGNGAGTVAVTGAGSELCIVQTGAGDLSGNLTYVQQ